MPNFALDQFLPYLLNQAAEVTSQSFQAIYKRDYAMTRTQWRVMANLGRFGAMAAAEIIKLTFIEKTKVSRAVQALHEKGFLKRVSATADRRKEVLSLTPAGMKVFEELGRKAAAFDQTLRQRLGAKAAHELEKTLRELMADAS